MRTLAPRPASSHIILTDPRRILDIRAASPGRLLASHRSQRIAADDLRLECRKWIILRAFETSVVAVCLRFYLWEKSVSGMLYKHRSIIWTQPHARLPCPKIMDGNPLFSRNVELSVEPRPPVSLLRGRNFWGYCRGLRFANKSKMTNAGVDN
jgi:hypothetical protein